MKIIKRGTRALLARAANLQRQRTTGPNIPKGPWREPPFLLFSRPGKYFIVGEPIMVSVYNPEKRPLQIIILHFPNSRSKRTIENIPWKANPTIINLSDITGDVQIVAQEPAHHPVGKCVRSNAITATILQDTPANQECVKQDRLVEHRLDCAIQRSATCVLTLHDPWILPGNATYPSSGKWFPTPVWEGATSLYNEVPEYYEDPLKYLTGCLTELKDKGFTFATWHELLEGRLANPKNTVLLQFDIDAGPHAFLRVAKALNAIGIRGTGMIHRRARHWYSYDFEDTGVDDLKTLEQSGWAFGYHHNALTNLVGFDTERATNPEAISQAQQDMYDDIADLRQHFDIKTLTHHGGNVLNYSVPIPDEAKVTCVDRAFSPKLWESITRAFSDGSFTSRPGPLIQFVKNANPGDGVLFMRCHPFKYGNFPDGLDVAPLTEPKSQLPGAKTVKSAISSHNDLSRLEKQTAWLMARKVTRSGTPIGYASAEKPLSSQFIQSESIATHIKRLRALRRPGFLRQYPFVEGDPRVIWWRVLSTFCGTGEILNVGAMPPDQKNETTAFLKNDAKVLEIDIDPDRKPDIVADFCSPEFAIDRTFPYVLLNGLPYFSDPAAAVKNAAKCLTPGGSLLIGAAGASHPERGGLFRPDDRPIWRPGAIEMKGESLSLTTLLWSFDKTSIADLMQDWPGTWTAEFLSHYWFVVAQRQQNG